MKPRKTVHYVNNKQMYETMREYIKGVRRARREKTEPPRVPEYIGECVYLICNKLSMNYNFINYTWRDEMVSDGIENCIMAVDNFDPKKTDNPFAYFNESLRHELRSLGVRCFDVELGPQFGPALNDILATATGQTTERVGRDVDRDYIMSPEQALQYGMIDEVVAHRSRK